MYLERGSYQAGSALEALCRIQPRPIAYGVDLRSLVMVNASTNTRFRAGARAVLAVKTLQHICKAEVKATDDSSIYSTVSTHDGVITRQWHEEITGGLSPDVSPAYQPRALSRS
jgi:hypothetical protein